MAKKIVEIKPEWLDDEFCIISECHIYKDVDNYFIKAHMGLEWPPLFYTDDGKKLLDYLLQHYGLEYSSRAGNIYRSFKTMKGFVEALKNIEEFLEDVTEQGDDDYEEKEKNKER